jgi:hypothetical protein
MGCCGIILIIIIFLMMLFGGLSIELAILVLLICTLILMKEDSF